MIHYQSESLGPRGAKVVLYLPNAPIITSPANITSDSLIEENGNHWRKILVIFAKLLCPDDNWRLFLRDKLLISQGGIELGTALRPNTDWHIVAGKANWQRLDLDENGMTQINPRYPSYRQGNLLLTPYPDYRQFPNALIAEIRDIIRPD